jgi:hypothetical protein
MGFKFIFLVFFEELLHAGHVLEIAQGLKGKVLRKLLGFSHRILVSHIFSLFSFAHGFGGCHLQCNCYNLNVNFLIFSRNFTRSLVLKF